MRSDSNSAVKAKDFIGKRLLALDYGKKRAGVAVCDELHITVSAREVLMRDNSQFTEQLMNIIKRENAAAIIVGAPYRHDNETTPLIEEIFQFIETISGLTGLPVIPFDESYSSRRAMQTMIAAGVRKKRRARKGMTDSVAATIILRDFLQDI